MGKSEVEVAHLAAAGERGKQVVDAERNPLLRQVGEKGLGITPPALDRRVVGLRDVEHAKVQLSPPGQLAGDLLAHEEIGPPGKLKSPLDGIVVGESNEVHPVSERSLVDGGGLGIALADEPAQNGQGQGA